MLTTRPTRSTENMSCSRAIQRMLRDNIEYRANGAQPQDPLLHALTRLDWTVSLVAISSETRLDQLY